MTGNAQAQTPSPSPKATPTPSPTARDFALHMRRFDAQLTDAQIDSIASQVDQLGGLRDALRPKGHDLTSGDAPTPAFEVGS